MTLLARRSARIDRGLLDLLAEAAGNCERVAGFLREMVAGFPERADLAREILLCEQEGDRITHDLIRRFTEQGTSSGLESGELHALAGALDDVVDHAEQAADRLSLYGIEAAMTQAEELSEVLVGATAELSRAIDSQREGSDVATHLVGVHQLESEGDRISRDALTALFTGHVDPMVVIRWKDVFESLEAAVDACERAAHVIEGIELKRAR